MAKMTNGRYLALPPALLRACPVCDMPARRMCVMYGKDDDGIRYVSRTLKKPHRQR